MSWKVDLGVYNRFKIVTAEKDVLIRDATNEMMYSYIEDYDDRTTPVIIENICKAASKQKSEEWKTFKRKSGLDGIQAYD